MMMWNLKSSGFGVMVVIVSSCGVCVMLVLSTLVLSKERVLNMRFAL